MSGGESAIDAELELLQRKSFSYFLHEANPDNGLVIDKTAADWPASIAATGLALAAYPVAVERGFMTRAAAVERTLGTLRFFWHSPQGPEPDATGYRGFYYHFLHMRTGRRAWQCELSTVDSALLIAGALTTGVYFDAETTDEQEIRTLADSLYRRTDWQWAQNGGATVTHGWKPCHPPDGSVSSRIPTKRTPGRQCLWRGEGLPASDGTWGDLLCGIEQTGRMPRRTVCLRAALYSIGLPKDRDNNNNNQ